MGNSNFKVEKIKNFDFNGVGLKNGYFIGLFFEEQDVQIVLLLVFWDVMVFYGVGMVIGLVNIFEVFLQFDFYDLDVLEVWKMGLFMWQFDEFWFYCFQEFWLGVVCYIEQLEEGLFVDEVMFMYINKVCIEFKVWVKVEIIVLFEQGKVVGIVGGEYSVFFGFLEVFFECYLGFGVL